VAQQVSAVRGLAFKHPVAVEPVSPSRMARLIRQTTSTDVPRDQAERQGRVLVTMGALPPRTDLFKAVVALSAADVIGFYDFDDRRLVFESGVHPSPFQRLTLAHELTHALDDQWFGLARMETLADRCLDDHAGAFVSLSEGDAIVTSIRWAEANLSAAEVQRLQREIAAVPNPPTSVPPFVQSEQQFPYEAGQEFVQALLSRGGQGAVDAAFRNPPASTEQILHPSDYPGHGPTDVRVPELSAKLGAGWTDLDAREVGEADVRLMFQLRLPIARAQAAAEGWNGGEYRAWDKGSHTVVFMETVWTRDAEATEFARAMREWLGDRPATVRSNGRSVDVFFATDERSLRTVDAAA
jgi:hypothetical protein